MEYESNDRLQTTVSDSYRRVDREDFGKPGTPERNEFDESAKRFVDEHSATAQQGTIVVAKIGKESIKIAVE